MNTDSIFKILFHCQQMQSQEKMDSELYINCAAKLGIIQICNTTFQIYFECLSVNCLPS